MPDDPDVFEVQTPECAVCGESGTVKVPMAELTAYDRGAMIQEAMPSVSPSDREQILTGIHSNCWDNMFTGMDMD